MTGLSEEVAELRIGQLDREVDRLTRELADERSAREHTWETLGKRTEELAERTRERDVARTHAEEWRDSTQDPERLPWEPARADFAEYPEEPQP